MDKEEFTFDEIVEEMKISKSSASTALKNLEIRGVIEYITYPGERKRYFRFCTGDVDERLRDLDQKLKQNVVTINKIIELKKDQNSRNAVFLKNVAKGMEFFIRKFDEFAAEYKNEQ